MPVNSTHPDYNEALPSWVMCNDFVAGTRAVKNKGEIYLPRPNQQDDSLLAKKRYDNYLKRAVFYEYSSKVVNQYLGLAFKLDPILDIDERLDALVYDADGQGTSLYHQAQKTLEALLVNGRCGILVDYPSLAGGNNSQADDARLNANPKLIFYPAGSIINWQDDMIVLHELVRQRQTDDPFVQDIIDQWRVLGLDEHGYYSEVWQQDDTGEFFVVPNSFSRPLDHNGKHWERIPFQIFGSQFNTFEKQKIPIEPLVHIEHGIYCNSADAENSRFMCGQIQPFLNMDAQTMDMYRNQETGEVLPFKLGSEIVLMLGEHGSFGFAQASPNTMATDGIVEKRGIISELGFQLGQASGAIKTATQAENETSAQHSQASLCVANINEGFLSLLNWCNRYTGAKHPPKFVIRQQFSQHAVDIGLLTQLSGLIDAGKLPKSVLYDKAKEFNLISGELSNDEIDGLIEQPSMTYEAFNQFRKAQGSSVK